MISFTIEVPSKIGNIFSLNSNAFSFSILNYSYSRFKLYNSNILTDYFYVSITYKASFDW